MYISRWPARSRRLIKYSAVILFLPYCYSCFAKWLNIRLIDVTGNRVRAYTPTRVQIPNSPPNPRRIIISTGLSFSKNILNYPEFFCYYYSYYYSFRKQFQKTLTSTAVKARYNKKTYDRLIVHLPKGTRDMFHFVCRSTETTANALVNKWIAEFIQSHDPKEGAEKRYD